MAFGVRTGLNDQVFFALGARHFDEKSTLTLCDITVFPPRLEIQDVYAAHPKLIYCDIFYKSGIIMLRIVLSVV